MSARVAQIFAGDVVKNKKPAPDIYNLAAESLHLDPRACWVVEDSSIGLRAAKSANMRCLVTRSTYTQNEVSSQSLSPGS
jgi:HAD superfamily hydrolase (TIGR01509 family)